MVYSYVVYVGIGALDKRFLEQPIQMSALSIIVCFFTSFILVFVFKSKFIQACLIKLFNTNLNTTIWDDVFDYKNGTNLKIRLKGTDYYLIGSYRYHEENTENPAFAISNYTRYDAETNQPDSVTAYENEDKQYLVFRLSDVEYMEIF